MRNLIMLAAALSLSTFAASASAQDACATARDHAADCSVHFCPLTRSPEGCAEKLSELVEGLSGETCDTEIAELVPRTTCFGLTETRLVGGAGGGGDICQSAFHHQTQCMDAFCEIAPDHDYCQAMAAAGDMAMDAMGEMACEGPAEEWAESVMSQSCDEILTMLGLVY